MLRLSAFYGVSIDESTYGKEDTEDMEQKSYKIKRLGWLMFLIFTGGAIYYFMPELLLRMKISDGPVMIAYKIILDCVALFVIMQFFKFVMTVVTSATDFDERWKAYAIEVAAVGAFVYFLVSHRNQSPLWINIIIFVVFLICFIVQSESHINKMKVLELNDKLCDFYITYQNEFDKIQRDVQRYNLKESTLLQQRVAYAENEREIRKAQRDQRSYSVKDRQKFPDEPDEKEYMGFDVFLLGRRAVRRYESKVMRCSNSLDKTCKKYEKRGRELKARENDLDNAIRYVQGTADEQEIEKIIGRSVDRAEKARKSYKKFNRRIFERKQRKI